MVAATVNRTRPPRPSTVAPIAVPPAAPAATGSSKASRAARRARRPVPRSSQSLPYPATAAASNSARNTAASGGRSAGFFARPWSARSRSGSGTCSIGIGDCSCMWRSVAMS